MADYAPLIRPTGYKQPNRKIGRAHHRRPGL